MKKPETPAHSEILDFNACIVLHELHHAFGSSQEHYYYIENGYIGSNYCNNAKCIYKEMGATCMTMDLNDVTRNGGITSYNMGEYAAGFNRDIGLYITYEYFLGLPGYVPCQNREVEP